ncbi:hypothetical protein BDW75DRAFT_246526 [Aspergillus navahoensis]
MAKKALAQLAHTLKLRASRIFLSSLLFWLLLYSYCRTKFWRDPHSAFFQEDHIYNLDYSLYREREAWHFISRHNAAVDSPDYTRGALGRTPICVAMVTVRRELDTYFEASVGLLLEGLTERKRRALHLSVLFTDTDPAVHPGWGQNDYLYALRTCQNMNASYTIIFEDDIILPRGVRTRPWLYLRLFYTETALGWSDVDAAYKNMPLIVKVTTGTPYCIVAYDHKTIRASFLRTLVGSPDSRLASTAAVKVLVGFWEEGTGTDLVL